MSDRDEHWERFQVDGKQFLSREVVEAGRPATSGLLDARGNPIAAPPRPAIGFHVPGVRR